MGLRRFVRFCKIETENVSRQELPSALIKIDFLQLKPESNLNKKKELFCRAWLILNSVNGFNSLNIGLNPVYKHKTGMRRNVQVLA